MKFTKLALMFLCSVILFCGCTKNNDVVLKINDKEITHGEFYSDFNKIKESQFKNTPKEAVKDDSYMVLALKERYINDVIVRELLKQEFDKRKIEATKQEIEAKKQQIIAQIGSAEQFNQVLKENNISDDKLNSDLASEVKLDKLVKSISADKVSDGEIERFYKQNKAQFTQPERIQVSHILIVVNPETIRRQITDADKEAKLSTADIEKKVKEEVARKEKLAVELQKKAMLNPKNFANLAKEFSDDKESALNGGDLGFVSKDSFVEEFSEAAFKQKVGTVSPLVKSKFGYHIIYVKDKAAAGTQPLSKVKEDLRAYLTQQKKVEALQKLINGLKDSAKIEFVDESLKPENIKKQVDEALSKQIQKEQKNQKEQKKEIKLNKNKK